MPTDLENGAEKLYKENKPGGGKGPILLPTGTNSIALDEDELRDVLPGVNGPLLRLATAVAVSSLSRQGMNNPTEEEVLDLLKEGWADWLPALRRKVIERGEFEL